MPTFREAFWNSLLAVLVVCSLVLSALVWFPPEQWSRATPPQVNVTPPSGEWSMPDIFRPERISVKAKGNSVALLSPGSESYSYVWKPVSELLSGINVTTLKVMETDGEPEDGAAITIVLPIALELREWAESWGWTISGLLNPRNNVDQVTLTAGPKSTLTISGPTGQLYRLGPLPEKEQKRLQEIINLVDGEEFGKYRPMVPSGPDVRVAPGLLVPDITEMKQARVAFERPDQGVEEARYFPDLSVVRQIDEQDAKGFTDGQRLLKFYRSGMVEYWAVTPNGSAPDRKRAEAVVQDWVDNHGGWSKDVVLSRFRQGADKSTLVFEIRSSGPYPVVSADGWARVEVAMGDRSDPGADRVTRFRRFPDMSTVVFDPTSVRVISPEDALLAAQQAYPGLLADVVRDLYPAYLVAFSGRDLETGWALEPVWVVQVGESPVYVPADERSDNTPRTTLP